MLLGPVEALEAIEPRLAAFRLPGSLTGLVATNEFLGAGDELLLFLILLELPRPAFGAQSQIAPVRCGIVLQPAKRQVERSAGYAIRKYRSWETTRNAPRQDPRNPSSQSSIPRSR